MAGSKIEARVIGVIVSRDIGDRLPAAAIAKIRKGTTELLKAVRRRWVGWKYEGRSLKTVGRSRAGWKTNLQLTEAPYTMTLSNEATDYYTGQVYPAYVARKKGAVPEHLIVYDRDFLPACETIAASIVEEVAKALPTKAKAPKIRRNRESTVKTLVID
jgi:hypothetical protein